jgi:hypothetical protein
MPMPKIAIPVANSYQELVGASNPSTGAAPETLPWWFYDTQLYTSGTTTQLTFFAAAPATPDLGNMPIGGALPNPNFFAIHYVHFDFLQNASGTPYVTVSAAAATIPATGALDDVGRLLLSGRGRFQITLSDKNYGPWPLSVSGGTGAAMGFTAVLSATTVGSASQRTDYGYNAVGAGAFIGGKVIIPPQTGFNIVATWPAALTLTGNYQIRATLYGVYYRRVL